MRKIIHSDAECAYDVKRFVDAAKSSAEDGLTGSNFIVRLEAAQEAEYWIKAVSALVFWSHVECLGLCNCQTAWGSDRPGRVIPVMIKCLVD